MMQFNTGVATGINALLTTTSQNEPDNIMISNCCGVCYSQLMNLRAVPNDWPSTCDTYVRAYLSLPFPSFSFEGRVFFWAAVPQSLPCVRDRQSKVANWPNVNEIYSSRSSAIFIYISNTYIIFCKKLHINNTLTLR